MQNCLSIAKDKEPVYNEIKCEDYNYDFQSVYNDDDDNYQSSIKNDHQLQPVIENDKRKQNQNLAGLFMSIDSSFIPNVENINGYLIYQEAKDFQFTITRKDALDKLILCVIDDQEPNYYWRSWQVSNYYLVELLRKQSEFPPQISITVKKTYELNKILTKYCYCGGCNINKKVTFKIAINKLDLISSENLVNIYVIFSLNKKQCKHLEGKTFGQCRGLSRQKLMEFDCKSPRNIRKQILSTVKSEIRYTGNRQGIPSANSARMINSAKKTKKQLGYNLCERLHAAILDINRKEKDEFLRINGSKSAVKRRIWGFIQEPI
ncbi:hypothetical protein RhiirB3_453635 [Rhizophagus irregularis]|nr:hypothetical protein RhiirB3_453635 [Rhizophagus irregularis]